jgi:nucleotide-binding universal stress UspA family protein
MTVLSAPGNASGAWSQKGKKHMFTQILVLLDGSKRAEQAIAVAQRLQETTHASLNLLSVIDPSSEPSGLDIPHVFESLGTAIQQEEEEKASYLASLVQHYRLPLSQTVRLVLQGPLFSTILSTLQEYHIDLVILCSHRVTAQNEQRLGHVAQQLMAQSRVPLLILKERGALPHSAYPDPHRPLHSVEIVVALDGSAVAEQAILPAAHLVSALAFPTRGTVHLVHIHCLAPAQLQWTREQIRETAQYQQSLHYVREQARLLQEREGDHLHLATLYSVVPASDITAGLIQFAEHRYGKVAGGSDLVTMYTHQRPHRADASNSCITADILPGIHLPLFVI